MKILYLSADPGIDLAEHRGGAIHVRAVVRALADLGHEVMLVGNVQTQGGGRKTEEPARLLLSSAPPQAEVKETSSSFRLPPELRPAPLAPWNHTLAALTQAANHLAGRTGRLHPDLVRALHNLTFARTAEAAARELGPDFIYERSSLWGVAGLRLARRRSIPLVLEVNAPLADEQQRYRGLTFPWLARSIERTVWRGADLVVAVSEPLRGHVQAAGVAAGRVRVLHNAADTRLFCPDVDGERVRRRLNLAGRFVVGFAGTFKAWHGVDFLLEAFEDLHTLDPSTHLLLVGDGPLRPALEHHVHRAGLEEAVTFTGPVAHEDMPAYLAAMDVAVAPYPAGVCNTPLKEFSLTSACGGEGFYFSPLKLFEYMAMGRPVVVSRVGGAAPVIVEGETALQFDPGDHAGLVACLQRLRRDATLCRELGRTASALIQSSYTWRHNAARVVSWVEPLVAARQAGAVPVRREVVP
jgi:glycosyltransferase involved in cell wall biosynthesis